MFHDIADEYINIGAFRDRNNPINVFAGILIRSDISKIKYLDQKFHQDLSIIDEMCKISFWPVLIVPKVGLNLSTCCLNPHS